MELKEFQEIIAYNVRIERTKKSLSQEGLAELAHVSSKYVTKIETCRVNPSSYILFKIAKVLGITVDKLVYKHED